MGRRDGRPLRGGVRRHGVLPRDCTLRRVLPLRRARRHARPGPDALAARRDGGGRDPGGVVLVQAARHPLRARRTRPTCRCATACAAGRRGSSRRCSVRASTSSRGRHSSVRTSTTSRGRSRGSGAPISACAPCCATWASSGSSTRCCASPASPPWRGTGGARTPGACSSSTRCSRGSWGRWIAGSAENVFIPMGTLLHPVGTIGLAEWDVAAAPSIRRQIALLLAFVTLAYDPRTVTSVAAGVMRPTPIWSDTCTRSRRPSLRPVAGPAAERLRARAGGALGGARGPGPRPGARSRPTTRRSARWRRPHSSPCRASLRDRQPAPRDQRRARLPDERLRACLRSRRSLRRSPRAAETVRSRVAALSVPRAGAKPSTRLHCAACARVSS